MKCMRCGTTIAAGAVFCDTCLAEMKTHPIKPGTPVNLPRREKQQPPKRSRRRFHKSEDQISSLRRLVVFLMAVILVLAIALTGAVWHLLDRADPSDDYRLPGQNYGTSEPVG